jgi:hypothetical protein
MNTGIGDAVNLAWKLAAVLRGRAGVPALSEGRAGTVHGGDRLPWVPLDTSDRGADNFTPLTSLEWQVHIYGSVVPEIRAACAELDLALHAFGWQPAMERAGLRRDALYLVRPDGYVALAAPEQSAPTLTPTSGSAPFAFLESSLSSYSCLRSPQSRDAPGLQRRLKNWTARS